MKGRANANLELRFSDRELTSHGGLELVRRYVGTIELRRQMRRALSSKLQQTAGRSRCLMAVLALMISGGRLVRHFLYLEGDPIVLRLCELSQLPTPRSVGRWLGEIRARHLSYLQAVNADLVAAMISSTKSGCVLCGITAGARDGLSQLKEECVWIFHFNSFAGPKRAVWKWIRRYNEDRPHQPLDYKAVGWWTLTSEGDSRGS